MSDEGHGGLDGIEEAYEASEFEREMDAEHMRLLYQRAKAKAGPVGSVVACPGCGKDVRKVHKDHVFCSRRGPGNCKDRYWNLTNEERRERAATMNR